MKNNIKTELNKKNEECANKTKILDNFTPEKERG